MRITRSLTIPALALALLAGGSACSSLTEGVGTPTPQPPAASCEEDMACWSCEDMGNRICGLPDVPANDAQRATAWETWDAHQGWHLLRVNPDKEVHVDVIGYATEPVTGGLSLHGADGLWYVFDAR